MNANTTTASAARVATLNELAQQTFDLLVIGGGIAGACTAWDASLRGLRVALIEKSDFGSGASAQSLKVLHGGIRYLQHLDIARLHESCGERAAFLRIAPHLTRPLPFALPTFGIGMRSKLPLRVAFAMLNVLTANRNKGIENRAQHILPPFIMSRREFLGKFPAFDQPGLTGAGVFYDGQMLNPPRIVYSIVRSAQSAGAIVTNYCAAESLLLRDGRVEGAMVRDMLSDARFEVRARMVANMTGPFAPALHQQVMDGQQLSVPLSRDMAVVVNRKLLPDMALGIQTRYRDPDAWLSRGNRHIFLVPWRQYTLVGVNSRVYEDDPFKLIVTEEEIEGFVAEIDEACPGLNIKRGDISVVNAGLLPFGENSPGQKNLSFGKRSLLFDHVRRGGPEGLVTGMSVRWTMGRLLGEKTVDLVSRKLDIKTTPCRTAFTQVYGGDFTDRKKLVASLRGARSEQLPEGTANHLADTFGSNAKDVLLLSEHDRVLPDGTTLESEIRYVVRNEMAVTLSDIVLRRLDLGTGISIDGQLLNACATIAAEELGWDASRRQAEVSRVHRSYPFASPGSQAYHGSTND